MNLLINRMDLAKYVQISNSCDDDILDSQILNAQFLDVMDLLGDALYNDLLINSGDAKYQTLLDGGTYTYSGTTYHNAGLKIALVYYTNARYIKFGSFVDTPFSIVEKINPEQSTPVSVENKQALYKLNQQIAYKYFTSARDFLNRNNETYPLWESDCVVGSKSFRINKIV